MAAAATWALVLLLATPAWGMSFAAPDRAPFAFCGDASRFGGAPLIPCGLPADMLGVVAYVGPFDGTPVPFHAEATLFGPLPAPTHRTVASVSKLAAQLAEVRHRGYALDIEENETGVRCAAVPIFLGRPSPAAAVSITVLGARAEPPRLAELGGYLTRTVAEWSLVPGG